MFTRNISKFLNPFNIKKIVFKLHFQFIWEDLNKKNSIWQGKFKNQASRQFLKKDHTLWVPIKYEWKCTSLYNKIMLAKIGSGYILSIKSNVIKYYSNIWRLLLLARRSPKLLIRNKSQNKLFWFWFWFWCSSEPVDYLFAYTFLYI